MEVPSRRGPAVRSRPIGGQAALEGGMVGRDRELEQLDAFLEAAQKEPLVLTLSGEAGIGKTTLWRAGLQLARQRGAIVLEARATPAEASLSFSALADMLDRVDDDVLGQLPLPQAEALRAALVRAPFPSGGIDDHAIFAGVLSVLRLLSGLSPVVVAIDDAQWLDSSSARALAFAFRRLRSEPVGFFVTVRPEEAPDGTFQDVAERDRRRSLQIGPLSVAALHALVKRDTGVSLPRPTVVRVARVAAGNPLYALEIANELVRRTPAAGADSTIPVPAGLRDLIDARVARLPPRARDALLVAASLSQATTDLVDVDALEPAEEAGLVRVDSRRVQFAHPLFASAVYAGATATARRRVHRRLAAVVPEAEERARHLALACPRPDEAVAAQLEEAAASVAARGAPGAAAEMVEVALALTPAAHSSRRRERLVAAAGYLSEAGDLPRAEELLGSALVDSGDDRLRARALQMLGQLHGRRSCFADAFASATAALALAGDDVRLRAEIELDLVYYSVSTGELASALGHADAAIALAESLDGSCPRPGCPDDGAVHGGPRARRGSTRPGACVGRPSRPRPADDAPQLHPRDPSALDRTCR